MFKWEMESSLNAGNAQENKYGKQNCNNYRGVSITSTLSGLYSKIPRDLIQDDIQE